MSAESEAAQQLDDAQRDSKEAFQRYEATVQTGNVLARFLADRVIENSVTPEIISRYRKALADEEMARAAWQAAQATSYQAHARWQESKKSPAVAAAGDRETESTD